MKASTFCLPNAWTSERAARLRSMFSRTASEEAAVTDSNASVADLAARGAVFAVAISVSMGLGAPLKVQDRRQPAYLEPYMLCCTCEVNRYFAAVQHAAG